MCSLFLIVDQESCEWRSTSNKNLSLSFYVENAHMNVPILSTIYSDLRSQKLQQRNCKENNLSFIKYTPLIYVVWSTNVRLT